MSVELACVQGGVEEQYADIDSEKEPEDATLQDPSSAEENNEDLEWCHQLPSDKADVHQFVGEQSGLDKIAACNITENSQPRDFFLLYFQAIQAVIVQETNRYMQQDAQARNKQIHKQTVVIYIFF
jgi:hypothetical protein